VFIDAPLVVTNPTGQRLCEKHVGNRYGRWKVSANSTNLESKRLGGVTLRKTLEGKGFRYDDGIDGPPRSGRVVSECYPYTAIVGYEAFGYDERPIYKRKPKSPLANPFKEVRATACDGLIRRMAALKSADPPLDLRSRAHSHPRRRGFSTRQPGLQAPSGPARRRPLRVDGVALAPARVQALPSARRRPERRPASSDDHRAGPAQPARSHLRRRIVCGPTLSHWLTHCLGRCPPAEAEVSNTSTPGRTAHTDYT
jgi:hypothetical protein